MAYLSGGFDDLTVQIEITFKYNMQSDCHRIDLQIYFRCTATVEKYFIWHKIGDSNRYVYIIKILAVLYIWVLDFRSSARSKSIYL